MKMYSYSAKHFIPLCILSFIINVPGLSTPVQADEILPEDEIIQEEIIEQHWNLISPDTENVTINKKPIIQWKNLKQTAAEGTLILLDGIDITAMVINQGKNSTFIPFTVLAAGEHNLYISATTIDGTPVEQEFFFSIRHTKHFEEAYSNNQLSMTYRGVGNHFTTERTPPPEPEVEDEWIIDDFSEESEPEPVEIDDFADASFVSYLGTESLIREGNWATSFVGNIRYFDHRADILDPDKRGMSVIDLLLTSTYSGETVFFEAGIGDNGIEESTNTIDSLYRRGIKGVTKIGNVTVTGFGVIGDEQTNKVSEMGLRFDSNDHIMGVSAQIDFFDQQMSFKGIYSNGGEEGDSFGTWSESGPREGDVYGLVFTTDFFQGMLTSEIEYDEATVEHLTTGSDDEDIFFDDPESAPEPEVASQPIKDTDKAYRIRISGMKEEYSYEISYEHTGPQYEVIGNQGLTNDRAGYNMLGYATFERHAFAIYGNSFWDNVDNDELYQRVNSLGGGVEYSFLGWQMFPLSVKYEKGAERSEDEPVDVEETSFDIDTIGTTVRFQDGPWAVELTSSFSNQDDRTMAGQDNEISTIYFAPGYMNDYLSLMPSWTYNTSKDMLTDIRTDTHTYSLDLQSMLLQEHLLLEAGGSYDRSSTEDGLMDSRSFQGYGRATYRFSALWQLISPSIALEYTREYQKDAILDTKNQEDIVTLILSTSIPYMF